MIADTVYAELWQSAEPGNADTRPAGTGDAWASATIGTLTAGDVYIYGSRSNGYFGWTQIPIDSAAELTKMVHRRQHVMSGVISDLTIGNVDAAAGSCDAFLVSQTYATKTRIDGQLLVENSDFRNLKGSTGSTNDFNLPSGSGFAFGQNLIRRRNLLVTPLADTHLDFTATAPLATNSTSGALTPSPGTWQNRTGCLGSLAVQGGTVTKIEISKDGTTYRDTGVIAGSFRMAPNWWARFTYTVAPTAYFVAED